MYTLTFILPSATTIDLLNLSLTVLPFRYQRSF